MPISVCSVYILDYATKLMLPFRRANILFKINVLCFHRVACTKHFNRIYTIESRPSKLAYIHVVCQKAMVHVTKQYSHTRMEHRTEFHLSAASNMPASFGRETCLGTNPPINSLAMV